MFLLRRAGLSAAASTLRTTELLAPSSLNRHRRRALSTAGEEPVTTTTPAAAAAAPADNPDEFGVSRLFTVSDLFQARVHLGHAWTAADPRMRPFLLGRRFQTSIIDLDLTALHLRQALNFAAHLAYKGGLFLFVARQPHLTHMVERAAKEVGEYAHCRTWKSEILMAPQTCFEGEVRLPDAIIILHTKEGIKYHVHPAVADAAKAGIPTLAVVDSDCNPNLVTYPVPGNDDTPQAVKLYLTLFQEAIRLGKERRKVEKEERERQESQQQSSSEQSQEKGQEDQKQN